MHGFNERMPQPEQAVARPLLEIKAKKEIVNTRERQKTKKIDQFIPPRVQVEEEKMKSETKSKWM